MPLEGIDFRNTKVELDGHHYIRCKFDGCVMVYLGTRPVKFTNCEYGDFELQLDGMAAVAVQLFRNIYQDGKDEEYMLNNLLKVILGNDPLDHGVILDRSDFPSDA